MAEDYVSRLILETRGAEGVKDVRQAVTATDAALRALIVDWGKGTISQEEFDKEAARLNRTLNQQTATLHSLETAQENASAGAGQATAVMGRMGTASKSTHAAIIEVGRGLEDLAVAGPIGAINNLNRLFEILSNTLKLTGPQMLAISLAITGIGIAANMLIRRWDEWFPTEKIKGFQTEVEKLKDFIKELSDKPVKLLIDAERIDAAQVKLDKLTKALAAYKAASEAPTEETAAAGKILGKVITEEGQGKLVEAVEAAQKKEGKVFGETERVATERKNVEATLADPRTARLLDPVVKERMENWLAEQAAAGRERIKAMLGSAAQGGETARKTLEGIYEKGGGEFEARGIGPEFGAGLRAARPERVSKEGQRRAQEDAKDVADEFEFLKRRAEEEKKAADTIISNRAKQRGDSIKLRIDQEGKATKTAAEQEEKGKKERIDAMNKAGEEQKKAGEEAGRARDKLKAESDKALAPLLPEIEAFMGERAQEANMMALRPRERQAFQQETQAQVMEMVRQTLEEQGMEAGRAEQIAQGATGAAAEQFNRQVLQMQRGGLTNQEAQSAVTQQLIANQQMIAAQLQAQREQILQNGEQAGQVGRQLRNGTTSPLNRGSN